MLLRSPFSHTFMSAHWRVGGGGKCPLKNFVQLLGENKFWANLWGLQFLTLPRENDHVGADVYTPYIGGEPTPLVLLCCLTCL